MTDKTSYPENPLIRTVIEKIFTIIVCSFIIILGNHNPILWQDILEQINISWLIYYVAWGVAFYSIVRMVTALYMISKHDKMADI